MKLDNAKSRPAARRRVRRPRLPDRILGVGSSVVVAVVLAVAATAWVVSGQIEDQGAPATGAASPPAASPLPDEQQPRVAVRVHTMTAQPRVQAVVVRGTTEASREVTVRAQTAGRVAEIAAARGAEVEEGAPIMRIALDDRSARLAEAEALARQRRIEYEAARKLAAKGHRSDTAVAAARAQYEAAQAAVARIETDIAHTEVAAPFAGVLNERPVEIGDFVDVGDPVATVVDLDPVIVTAFVSENEIGKLAVGDTGSAELITGQELEGTVRYISRSAQTDTRTFRIELEVPNPRNVAAAGVTAEMRLPVTDVPAHRVSPAVLTLDDQGRVGIKTVDEDDVVRFHPVRIIDDTDDGIWLGGLPETIRVITVGQEFVKEGQTVAPKESSALAEGGQ